jgi:hypothetical protein
MKMPAKYDDLIARLRHADTPHAMPSDIETLTDEAATALEALQRELAAALASPQPAVAQADAEGERVTCMTEDQARDWAWKKVRRDVGTEDWTTGDHCNYFGFYCWGWTARAQYEKQRPRASLPSRNAVPHGHRSDYYLLANARRIVKREYQRSPNWVIAMELFATGSNSAHQICKDAGIDPDGSNVSRAIPTTVSTEQEAKS